MYCFSLFEPYNCKNFIAIHKSKDLLFCTTKYQLDLLDAPVVQAKVACLGEKKCT